MVALRIEDVKDFTLKLFMGAVFDRFLVREVTIVTYNTFQIDGHIKRGYYTKEEQETEELFELSAWKSLKPICFSLIKGKRLPGSFQITLQLSPVGIKSFLSNSQLNLTEDQINGLYLDVRYDEEKLLCVTGTSLNIFRLDKLADHSWDDAVRSFLRQNQIVYIQE